MLSYKKRNSALDLRDSVITLIKNTPLSPEMFPNSNAIQRRRGKQFVINIVMAYEPEFTKTIFRIGSAAALSVAALIMGINIKQTKIAESFVISDSALSQRIKHLPPLESFKINIPSLEASTDYVSNSNLSEEEKNKNEYRILETYSFF